MPLARLEMQPPAHIQAPQPSLSISRCAFCPPGNTPPTPPPAHIQTHHLPLLSWRRCVSCVDQPGRVPSPHIQARQRLSCCQVRDERQLLGLEVLYPLTSRPTTVPTVPAWQEEEEKTDGDGLPTLADRKDMLKEELARRAEQANEFLLTAARLIAPVMNEKSDWVAGYKWVIEQLRTDHEAVSNKVGRLSVLPYGGSLVA